MQFNLSKTVRTIVNCNYIYRLLWYANVSDYERLYTFDSQKLLNLKTNAKGNFPMSSIDRLGLRFFTVGYRVSYPFNRVVRSLEWSASIVPLKTRRGQSLAVWEADCTEWPQSQSAWSLVFHLRSVSPEQPCPVRNRLSVIHHPWRVRRCPETGISRLLIRLQLSVLDFCHLIFSIHSCRHTGFLISLIVVKNTSFPDFSLRFWFAVSRCCVVDLFGKYFDHSVRAVFVTPNVWW